MLKSLCYLKPFFEDTTIELGVREYSRAHEISPPTASKILNGFYEENLLKRREDRRHLLFRANTESRAFALFQIAYFQELFEKSGLINHLNECFLQPKIILFGSVSKAENTKQSDIDICLISPIKKEADVLKYEKKLGRKIQIFVFRSIKEIHDKNLLKNILKGVVLSGTGGLCYGLG